MTVIVETHKIDVVEVSATEVDVNERIIIEVVDASIPGPQGATGVGVAGPQGPPGSGGASYVHDQMTPSATWVVVHNMGYYPNVTVEDSGGNEHFPDLVYDSANQLTLTFNAANGGKAYLS